MFFSIAFFVYGQTSWQISQPQTQLLFLISSFSFSESSPFFCVSEDKQRVISFFTGHATIHLLHPMQYFISLALDERYASVIISPRNTYEEYFSVMRRWFFPTTPRTNRTARGYPTQNTAYFLLYFIAYLVPSFYFKRIPALCVYIPNNLFL